MTTGVSTMRDEKTAIIFFLLASVFLTVQSRNILQDMSLNEDEQQQQFEEERREMMKHQLQQTNLKENKRLTPADISILVLNHLRHRLDSSIPSTILKQESRRANAPEKESKEQKVKIVVRPVLTPEKWLRLCRSRSKSERFPGCDVDLLRDRQKREEMLRNNLAALLSGLKGSDRRQRLRMHSLRFG